MSNQEGIGNSFSAFSFPLKPNGIAPILDPRTDSPVNNTRKSPRPSASPIGSSNQDSFFGGGRPWDTAPSPSNNTSTSRSWGTNGSFQPPPLGGSLLSPSSHISDIWSFSLPTFSSDNSNLPPTTTTTTTTSTSLNSNTFRSLDNTPNSLAYSRSPNNNPSISPRFPATSTTTSSTTNASTSFTASTSFGRYNNNSTPVNEESTNEEYLGEDVASSPGDYDPSASDAFPTSGEHPLGEHPSRTLFVRNINSNLEDEELSQMFEQYGPIRNMYTQCKHRGFVMISYYDIRHAKNAMRYLQGKLLRKRKLDIHYSIPKDNPSERDQNQGTLVVFNLDPSTSNEELKLIFGQFGEIKEIRETPNKKHHKFIEFYDIRDADKAMKNLNKTEIKGKKIKIEPSRPGGRRTPVPPNLPNNNSNTTTSMAASTAFVSTSAPPIISSNHHHLSHSLDNNSHNNSSSNSFSNNSHLHNLGMFPHSLPDDDSLLFPYNSLPNQFSNMHVNNNSNTANTTTTNSSLHNPSNPFQYSSSDLFGSLSSNYSPPTTSKGLVASSSLGSTNAISNGNNNNSTIMRNRSSSFSTTDINLNNMMGPPTSNNIWSDPFSSLSPRGGFNPNSNSNSNTHFNTNNISTTSSTSAFHRIGGFSPPPQHLPSSSTNPIVSTTPPSYSDIMFDSTIRATSPASKSFEGIAESRSRNRSHSIEEDRSKYILSLDRVRNGGDPRTTLMIKNIPNKYSQKMLLATVDEKHKGTYDFFYLPIDFKNKCNVGYAFINFTNPEYIIPFYEDFNNKKWEKFNSEKVCDIAYARIQGKNALITHFQNSSLMGEDKKCRPIIFHDGEPESFPLNNSVVNVASPRRSRSSSISSQGSREEDSKY